MISGGSYICDTSYFVAKRNAKVLKTEKEERPQKNASVTNEKDITFDKANRQDVNDPHHDRLVITLYIANHFFRRILVNRGPSVNIMLIDAWKGMNIHESEIVKSVGLGV